MSNSYGTVFRITTFGESHGNAVGVIIDGCPSGLELNIYDVQRELDRRRPGQSKYTTSRDEYDKCEILSGVFDGKTTGTPISIIVKNNSCRSSDYNDIKDIFRPGHADYTYYKKYGIRDYRGGGRASARETIGRVAAGAVAKKILASEGIFVFGYVIQIGSVKSVGFNKEYIEQNDLRCSDEESFKKMSSIIDKVKRNGDSIGGVVEVKATGVPVGIGEPIFDKLTARLAYGIMSIPGVKGIEFGRGFDSSSLKGSQMNDEITSRGFLSNNSGGILGGISNGEDIILRFVLKPTSSITVPKRSIDVYGNDCTVITKGRHDPCLVPRAVPIGESMVALTLLDMLMLNSSR